MQSGRPHESETQVRALVMPGDVDGGEKRRRQILYTLNRRATENLSCHFITLNACQTHYERRIQLLCSTRSVAVVIRA